ncbi:hypothetical protein ABVK25_006783 [Lepraria finkii]|uniref:Major facilitator superfamily (MFS) profile domain-containing protein n=1 Tax=Lepraria finkii TaxID=1340010 RepID=A0ABR4B4P9_9LECA
MNTETLAEAFSPNEPQGPQKRREQLAVLEGHDADIPTADQSSYRVKGPHTTIPDYTPSTSSYATAPATHRGTSSANSERLSIATLNAKDPHISTQEEALSGGLAPSTAAQWAPSASGDAVSGLDSSSEIPTSIGFKDFPTPTKQSAAPKTQHTNTSSSAPPLVLASTAVPSSSHPEKLSSTTPEAGNMSSMSDAPPKASPDLEKETMETDLEVGTRSSSSSNKEEDTQQAGSDPNIVDWDGPDDPANPMNWSEKLKWGNVAVISSITFLTPLASSMFAPGVPDAMIEFHSSSVTLASFVVSVYVLGYAFGPLVIAPVSELYGRLPVYHVCNVLFVIFTIACAVSTNLNMLIGIRFLEGTFGSCPLTIGGGTIADMIIQEKRGGVMAIWALGPLMGPVIGPVAGGYLSQAKGWRWVFWVIATAAGAITISAFFFIRETYAPILLERKAKKLRKETGNMNFKSKLASKITPSQLWWLSIVRPMKMLVFSPIVLALSTYMAVVYGYLYLLFTTLTEVYEGQYGFSQGSVGLTFLGIGVGSLFGVIIFGIASDRILKAKSKGGVMKPEYRLPPMIPGSFLVPIGLFLYGWSADQHVQWIVPIIGTGLVGVGLLATFMPIQLYLVDAFTIYAASALAANTVLRSLVGALLPLAGRQMYMTLGLGWGNSLLAFIALAMCPIPLIFYKYGERIRTSHRFQINL